MIKYGLKLWSNNIHLIDEALKKYHAGKFDFVEVYSNSQVEPDYNKLEKLKIIPVLGVHMGHLDKAGFHTFYLTEDQKKPWRQTVDLADFFATPNIIVHPAAEHTSKTFWENLEKIDDGRIIIETMPAKSSEGGITRNFGTALADFREIKEKKEMCFDVPKTIKAAVFHRVDYKEYLAQALEIIQPEYFHISGCNLTDPMDEHGNIYEAGYEVVWVKTFLENYAKDRDIYLVFETPKIGENLENDMKNIDYFKAIV